MIIENPPIPEGINISRLHPVAEMFMLLAAMIGLTFAFMLALTYTAEFFADRVPFEFERDLVAKAVEKLPADGSAADSAASGIEEKLQALAEKLAAAQTLPPGMTITIHYSANDVVNAFATLGGHIFIFKGLIDKLESENSLAMVLAHEIAHIKHRDPVRSMVRAMGMSLALATVFGSTDSGGADALASDVSMLTALNFSRGQETEADEAALAAVATMYGHVRGCSDLFLMFLNLEEKDDRAEPEFLRSHPVTLRRIEHLDELAASHGWPVKGELSPIQPYKL